MTILRMMAFIRLLALALALGSSTAWSSHPFESARDQYEAREDRPHPQLLTEATDHRPGVHMFHKSDFIKKSTDESKQPVPDLQVGCGDGFIQEKTQEVSETDKNKIQKKSLTKRSYFPWRRQVTYSVPAYQSITVWQPPLYQLSRPYYIPIFGVPGRIPIYYPSQPIYNPGVPKDNPSKKPFKGPTYLPPVETTTMDISDRFNGGDNSDDRPVWGDGYQPTTPGPRTTTSVIPTRRPRPSRPRTPPPLVHNPTDPEGFESEGVSTVAPPQSLPLRPNEPSRCVWAIISCCSSDSEISYDCFEQRGCPGAFWDNNPCGNEFAQSAIAAALNYYNK